MRTKGIHRIKDWAIGRLRRGRAAGDSDSGSTSEARPAMVHRLRGWFAKVGERFSQPRKRLLLRWLTFVFLVGAAYGLWQGSQDFIAQEGATSALDVPAAQPAGTVTELASRMGDTVLGANLPARLSGNPALAQAAEAERLPSVPPLPEILDLSQVVWPVTGGVDGAYGWYRDPATEAWRFRSGLIIRPDRDPAPVRASLPGEVVSIDTSGIGYRVVLAHAEGWTTEYIGLSSVDVRVGGRVEAGQTIGEFASAPHRDGLHYMVRDASGQPTDPSQILYTRTLR